MRLIDADALKPLLREYCVDGDEVVMKWYDIMGVDEVVDRAPTVDAVPVVRCKDCKYYHQTFCEIWSKYGTIQTREQGFCYMAERRDDD